MIRLLVIWSLPGNGSHSSACTFLRLIFFWPTKEQAVRTNASLAMLRELWKSNVQNRDFFHQNLMQFALRIEEICIIIRIFTKNEWNATQKLLAIKKGWLCFLTTQKTMTINGFEFQDQKNHRMHILIFCIDVLSANILYTALTFVHKIVCCSQRLSQEMDNLLH